MIAVAEVAVAVGAQAAALVAVEAVARSARASMTRR